jgi:hypothetical protein
MRDYRRAVVNKVFVNGNSATMSGSNAKLLRAVGAKNAPGETSASFMHEWCAIGDESGHWETQVSL